MELVLSGVIAEPFGHLLSNGARLDVGGSAGRKRHDDPYRLAGNGKGLREGGAGGKHCARDKREHGQGSWHGHDVRLSIRLSDWGETSVADVGEPKRYEPGRRVAAFSFPAGDRPRRFQSGPDLATGAAIDVLSRSAA